MVFLDNDPSPFHQGITLATEKTLNYSRQAHTFEPFVNLGKREKGLPSTETSSKKVSHNSFPSHVWSLLFFNRHFSCFSPLFRTCQMRVVRFYVRPSPPSSPSHPPSCPCQPRSPTASVLCAPQPPSCAASVPCWKPPSSAASVPCWTSTAIPRCQRSLPDLNQQKECQKRCQKECQKEWEKMCWRDCRKECQNRCQKECQRQMAERLARTDVRKNVRDRWQKDCPKECQKRCQKECQKRLLSDVACFQHLANSREEEEMRLAENSIKTLT